MEKDLQELENLKKKLFSNQTSEDDQIFNLRQVMKEVGGYEQLMNLPIATYNIIIESIVAERKAQIKAYNKSHRR